MKIRKFNVKSIFFRLSVVMFSALMFQALFMAGVFVLSQISHTLADYGIEVFEKTVGNRTNYIEGEMTNRWSNITQFKDEVVEIYENTPSGEELEFLTLATPVISEMISSSLSTGGFVILDTPTNDGSYPCVYLESFNSNVEVITMQDFNLVRGPSEVSTQYQIPLPHSWSYSIQLDEEDIKIITNPISMVELTDEDRYRGYWHVTDSLENEADKMITYSLPMISSDGKVLGVIGTSVSQDYLSKILPFDDFSDSGSYGYAITQLVDGDMIAKMSLGTIQRSIMTVDEPIAISLVNSSFNTYVTDTTIGQVASNYGELNIYPSNSPFEDEKYYVMGITDYDSIMNFANNANGMIIFELVASFAVAIIFAIFIGRRFSKPIIRLSANIRQGGHHKNVSLQRTGTLEIDELAREIEDLSVRVADSATKTDKILHTLNMGVATFEYSAKDDFVAISKAMGAMFTFIEEGEVSVDKKTFLGALDELKNRPHEELENTFLANETPELWLKVTEMSLAGSELGVIEDVTKDVAERRQISFELNYDMLTGIYNRSAFRRIAQGLFDKGIKGQGAFVMLDLDNLKYVNDTFGHESGDLYIKKAASVMSEVFAKNTLVARMSGDEFYAFFHNFEKKEDILDNISKMYVRLDEMHIDMPNRTDLKVRISAGLAWYKDDADDIDTLMRYADFAMYEGKNTVKGELRIFNKKAYEEESYMLSGKEELNRVLDNQFIYYALQPIVRVKDCSIYAYEALMRPQSKLLNTPDKLLKIAASQSQLWKVERVTFFKAMSTYVRHKALFGDAKIFINSVPNEMLRDSEYTMFADMYSEHLKNIVVEILETDRHVDNILFRKIDTARQWGAGIALDDYGSGYNSDINLIKINPDIVKIDRSIIDGVENDPHRQSIVQKTINHCKTHSIGVLAEGVETFEQMRWLVDAGVDYLQGYYIAKPMFTPNYDVTKIAHEIKGGIKVD